jgi:hypothetical protein
MMSGAVAAVLFGIVSAATTTSPRNACQLLTPREVARVQGEAFQSTKLTESSERGLSISQCFYTLPSYAKSVSVDIMRGKAVDFWKQHFAEIRQERDDERESEAKKESEHAAKLERDAKSEPESEARPVRGVGDAAVWSGNRMAGALYVLRGDTVLRVSVGGPGTADEKIERSKKLAAKALRRL